MDSQNTKPKTAAPLITTTQKRLQGMGNLKGRMPTVNPLESEQGENSIPHQCPDHQFQRVHTLQPKNSE